MCIWHLEMDASNWLYSHSIDQLMDIQAVIVSAHFIINWYLKLIFCCCFSSRKLYCLIWRNVIWIYVSGSQPFNNIFDKENNRFQTIDSLLIWFLTFIMCFIWNLHKWVILNLKTTVLFDIHVRKIYYFSLIFSLKSNKDYWIINLINSTFW